MRTTREPRPRNSKAAKSRNKDQIRGSSSRGVRRDDGLPVPLPAGRLSPLSPNIQLPPTLLRRRLTTDFTFELISRLFTGERQVRLRSSRGPHRPASPGHGTDLRDLEKQPRFGFLPAMASLSAPSWPSLSAPSRWCTASPPQSQRGGVLDGGDSPHEPRLHWSTCASTRRTMSPSV